MNAIEIHELMSAVRDNKHLREQIEVQRVLIEKQRETLVQHDAAARTLHGMGWTFDGTSWIAPL